MSDFFKVASFAELGQLIFSSAMLAVIAFALIEVLSDLLPGNKQENHSKIFPPVDMLSMVTGMLPASSLLALVQLAGICLAIIYPSLRVLAPVAFMYLIVALCLPFLYAAGAKHAIPCQIPRAPLRWKLSFKRWTLALLALSGIVLSIVLVTTIDIRPGDSVHELSKDAASDLAMILVAVWLLFNAPWMEETVFRHYLIPRLATLFSGRPGLVLQFLAVVISATVFALGHAGHMVPAWPKLVQTFIWGLMFGWVRIYLGTQYAIGLHLVFNLSAPLAAPFLLNE